jgi:dienelactone hydrolase
VVELPTGTGRRDIWNAGSTGSIGGRRERSLTVDFSRSNKSFVLTMRLLLFGLAIFCAGGCSQVESINFTLPKCSASYAPSIGKDLIVGESSDEFSRRVGKPNQIERQKGYTYYVYYVQPYLLRGFDSKELFLCDSAPLEDWSAYLVTFDADMKARSVVYYMFADPDSQRVRVPGADGLMLPATLYRPRRCSTSREPAIVLLHGWIPGWRDLPEDPLLLVSVLLHGWIPGGLRDNGDTDTGQEWTAQLLAERGYVVLLPLMRGWGGGQDDCGLTQPADTARMIEWLASEPGVDPDRIGVMGVSFGGQVALLTGAVTPRAKAIVSYAGPTDLVSLNVQLPWYHWLPRACRSDLKSRSPVTVASRIKAPVLLIQGDADTIVPPVQAEEMEQALRKSGGSVQLHLVSGVEHQDGDNLVLSSWTATQQFLEATLGKPSCVQTLHAPSASAQPTPRALEAQ